VVPRTVEPDDLKDRASVSHKLWKEARCPRTCPIFDLRNKAKREYRIAIRRCRGLVAGRADVRCVLWAIATFWPLRPRQTVKICDALSGQSVELKLSVWAHVFFSCEGRMKVVKTSVRESVMLPIGAAYYLMWKSFRGSGNGVRRLFVLVEQSGDLPVVSWPFHLLYRRGCCDGSSGDRAVVTSASVQWWSPLKFLISRRTFLSCWPDNGSNVF